MLYRTCKRDHWWSWKTGLTASFSLTSLWHRTGCSSQWFHADCWWILPSGHWPDRGTGWWHSRQSGSAKDRLPFSRRTQCLLLRWSASPTIQTSPWTEKEKVQLQRHQKCLHHRFLRKKSPGIQNFPQRISTLFWAKIWYRSGTEPYPEVSFCSAWHFQRNSSS